MKLPHITPGPWKWSGTNARPSRACYLTGGSTYGNVGAALEGFTDDPANAQAIAATPDTLATLLELRSYLQAIERETGVCTGHGQTIARAALLKAGATD